MSQEEEELLLSEDELLNSAKPDQAEGRKRTREISRLEFEDLQGQVKSVTDALNNFGELFRTYLCGEKRPRMSDCDPAAQSTSTVQFTCIAQSTLNAGQSAFITAHPVTSVSIPTSAAVSLPKPPTSIALQSQIDGISPPLHAPSPGNESFFSAESLDTGFNPVYVDPDFLSTDAGPSFPSVAPDDEDIPQISYEGDEPTGTDIPSSFASYVEGCTKKKIKKEDVGESPSRFLWYSSNFLTYYS